VSAGVDRASRRARAGAVRGHPAQPADLPGEREHGRAPRTRPPSRSPRRTCSPRCRRLYFGPVILVTDARCYSAADIFAAGFQDNGIGPVLGVDGNTGAGGGNVWSVPDLLGSLPAAGDFPFRPLPRGADLSVVIRRLLRVGPNAGTPSGTADSCVAKQCSAGRGLRCGPRRAAHDDP
jgi:hypothetical protein